MVITQATRSAEARTMFGRGLQEARVARGLTQEDLIGRLNALWEDDPRSARPGVSAPIWYDHDASWVSRLEAGQVMKLTPDLVDALCRALEPDDGRHGALAPALLVVAGFWPLTHYRPTSLSEATALVSLLEPLTAMAARARGVIGEGDGARDRAEATQAAPPIDARGPVRAGASDNESPDQAGQRPTATPDAPTRCGGARAVDGWAPLRRHQIPALLSATWVARAA